MEETVTTTEKLITELQSLGELTIKTTDNFFILKLVVGKYTRQFKTKGTLLNAVIVFHRLITEVDMPLITLLNK